MKKNRLGALADGIFAIVMTLLVLEIKVPTFPDTVNNLQLWESLVNLAPSFMSYVLSFIVLASYWMAHHYIVSILAKNLTRKMTYLNIPFLMAVALIPFSSHMLSLYYYSQVAIVIYGLNVTIIGFLLFLLLWYAIYSKEVENEYITKRDLRFGYIRIMLQPLSAIIAIPVAYIFNPTISIAVFVVVALFNIFPGGLALLESIVGKKRHDEMIKEDQ